jgi:MinD-like ATPase involved in chromosome partitioning or flagellar assembly
MTEIRNLIADVDIGVVDPDLLWRVGHMNLLRGAVVRDFAAPEEAIEALTPGRPAVLVLGPAAEDLQVTLVVEARRARPELRTVRCVPWEPHPRESDDAAEGADAESGEGDGGAEGGEPASGAALEPVPEAEGFDATIADGDDEGAFIALVEELLAAVRALDEPEPPIAVEGTSEDDDSERAGDEASAADASKPVGAADAAPADRAAGRAHRAAPPSDLRPRPGLELPPRLAIVTGAKGGEGTSTVALNLAHELASRAGVATAIVDGEPFFGDIVMDMGAVPARTPVVTGLPLSSEVLAQLVTFPAAKTEPIAIRSPVARDDAATRGPEVLRTLLSVAGRIADVVIADVPLELVVTCPWLDQVAVVVLVTTPRTASLKNALVASQRLAGSTNVGLVVNTIEHHQRNASAEEIAQALALPLFGHLPSDGKLRRAAMKSHPREIAEAHSHYGHAMTAVRRAVASHFPVLV